MNEDIRPFVSVGEAGNLVLEKIMKDLVQTQLGITVRSPEKLNERNAK